MMVNYNAYVHSSQYFDGKPRRFRDVQADFQGHVAELLAKSARQDKLDQALTDEDQQILLEALRGWGALDENFACKAGDAQVAAVVSYVRTHFGNVYKDKVSADQVKGLRSMAH